MSKITSRPRPEWMHRNEWGSHCYGPPDSASHPYDHVYILLNEDGRWECIGPARRGRGCTTKTIHGSLYLEVLLIAHELLLEERE